MKASQRVCQSREVEGLSERQKLSIWHRFAVGTHVVCSFRQQDMVRRVFKSIYVRKEISIKARDNTARSHTKSRASHGDFNQGQINAPNRFAKMKKAFSPPMGRICCPIPGNCLVGDGGANTEISRYFAPWNI